MLPFIIIIILQLLLVSSQATTSVQFCLHHERKALLAFKNSFTIQSKPKDFAFIFHKFFPRSTCQTPYAKTESWKIHGSTQWEGVTCDPLSGHVTKLDLSCSLLTGSFPSNTTLFLLRHLRHVNLAHNDFSWSSIPTGFARLSELTYLNLSKSKLAGDVPVDFSRLSRLTTIDLSGNYVKMYNFNTFITNLTDLRVLDFSGVNITSSFPPMIANLSKLESLRLGNCNLQGNFSVTSVLNMPKLRVLDLGYNYNMYCDFSPLRILQWRSPIELLDLSSCKFTTMLPDSIVQPSNFSLRYFNIVECGIYGDIPNWIWNVTKQINARINSFSGSLPATMNTMKLSRLSTIDFDKNKITGMVPDWMFTLPSLNSLSLSGNLFTSLSQSAIKVDCASSSLVEFYTNDNQLQGKIPEAIFGLCKLQYLNLENNNLTGTIPFSKFQKLQSLALLRLSNNNLTIIDESNPSWPSFWDLGLSSCNLGHFPRFLREQENLEVLEISNNGIHGLVPKWLLDIGKTTFTFLDLSHNFLTGGLEHLPWQNINNLDISYNMLEGILPIPSSSTNQFIASNNRFNREIPSTICELRELELLDLSHNNLTGFIPECFTSIVSRYLEILDLRQNQLQGEIPSIIFRDCPELFTLSLSGNLFEGPVPRYLSNCMKLQLLDVAYNKLNGTFPHWLMALSNLEVLTLGSNSLHGSLLISNTVKPFLKLRILDISNNNLTGGLSHGLLMSFKAMTDADTVDPLQGLYMTKLTYQDSISTWVKGFQRELHEILDTLVLIDASRNRLDGHIPEAIGDLIGIRWLNLAHNNFTGNIPSSLGNMKLLESLDLSFNRLDGQIPSQLVNLNSLEYFNVTENCLVGPVPTSKQFSTFSDNSYLGNPGLCGEFLTKKCERKVEPPNSTPAEDSGFESSDIHEWEIVLMGVGCGLFVGLVWGYFIFWERNYYCVQKLIFTVEIAMMHRRRWPRQSRRN